MKWIGALCVVLALSLAGCTMVVQPSTPQPAEEMATAEPASEEMSSDDKIANALSAGPMMVVEAATVLDWPSDASGGLTELRAGSNGWTCLPDNPGSPTNDPLCGDAMWMEWLNAYFTGEEPEITGPGIAYMLQGESGASNDDPSLMEPPPGEDWITDGPHIMALLPESFDQEVFSTEHSMNGPYLMFAGTPYEHLMVPVETVDAQPADDRIANAMSAAPDLVSKDATIIDFDANGEIVELRAGTNGWTCVPDNPGTPTDDPICADAMWLKWFEAYVAGEDPDITAPGIGYMLQGESGASNDDPTLMQPPAGQDWIEDGPHIMLLLPQPFDPSVFSTEHSMDGPYLMFPGTPYEHMMIPLAMPKGQ